MSAWQTAALSDVLAEAKPGFACGEDPTDGVFQFRMNNITTEGQIDLTKKRRVHKETRNIDSFLAEPGDVLFNATNSPELVGKAAYFPGLDEPAVFSNHFLRLRPHPARLEGRFLARWLSLQFQRGVFKGMCRQWVNQATVNRDSLLALRIPLPPLPEQRRIAEILDKADALRAKRRAALAELDDLTQSIFLDMFGDPVTNVRGWEMLRLEDVLARPLRNGLSPSHSGKIVARVLTLSAITGSKFDATALKTSTFQSVPPPEQRVDESDFLICRGNGNVRLVGKGYFPTSRMPDVTFPDTIIAARISPERVERGFLQHVWNSNAIRRQVESLARTTNGTFKVNQTMLERIEFVAPSIILQRKFSQRLTVVEKLKALYRSSCLKLDALFASLQSRAFRGMLCHQCLIDKRD
jgi:type I restriction enzyme S subunit